MKDVLRTLSVEQVEAIEFAEPERQKRTKDFDPSFAEFAANGTKSLLLAWSLSSFVRHLENHFR